MYFSGDGAIRDEDGYVTITGRMDDVINISGHRLGTAEIEDVLVSFTDLTFKIMCFSNQELARERFGNRCDRYSA